MNSLKVLAVLFAISTSTNATEMVEINFLTSKTIILPGDCRFTANNITFWCDIEGDTQVTVNFYDYEEFRKGFRNIEKSKKNIQEDTALEYLYVKKKQDEKLHHFSSIHRMGNYTGYHYTLCNLSKKCISAMSKNKDHVIEIMKQTSHSLLEFPELTDTL